MTCSSTGWSVAGWACHHNTPTRCVAFGFLVVFCVVVYTQLHIFHCPHNHPHYQQVPHDGYLVPSMMPPSSMAPAHSQGHISASSPRSAASFNAATGSSTSPATAGGDTAGTADAKNNTDLLASLASIRTALANGMIQQQDVLRMLGELSLNGDAAAAAAPASTESGSGTSATLTAGMSLPLATDDDAARTSGSKSVSPGPDAAANGGGLQPAGGSVVLPAPSPALPSNGMMGRLWHTSSAPPVGGVQTTLLVCCCCRLCGCTFLCGRAFLCGRTVFCGCVIHVCGSSHTPPPHTNNRAPLVPRLVRTDWAPPTGPPPTAPSPATAPSPLYQRPPRAASLGRPHRTSYLSSNSSGLCWKSCCTRVWRHRVVQQPTARQVGRLRWPRRRPSPIGSTNSSKAIKEGRPPSDAGGGMILLLLDEDK